MPAPSQHVQAVSLKIPTLHETWQTAILLYCLAVSSMLSSLARALKMQGQGLFDMPLGMAVYHQDPFHRAYMYVTACRRRMELRAVWSWWKATHYERETPKPHAMGHSQEGSGRRAFGKACHTSRQCRRTFDQQHQSARIIRRLCSKLQEAEERSTQHRAWAEEAQKAAGEKLAAAEGDLASERAKQKDMNLLLESLEVKEAKLGALARELAQEQVRAKTQQQKKSLRLESFEAAEVKLAALEIELKEERAQHKEKSVHFTEVITELKTEQQRILQQKEEIEQQLCTAVERLNMIRKDMGDRLLCPLSFKPMREPVIGTDLRTYQKDVIEEALRTKPASPFTRSPMEEGFLRPNLLATDFLELMAKHFPDWEADVHVQPPAPLPPVGLDLLRAALRTRNSDQVVELLGRDVDWEVLNGTLIIRSVEMTLLHVSLSQHLPKVACAIIKRPDFRRMENFTSQGVAAIHMAAAFNYGDVCDAILRDVGYHGSLERTLQDAHLLDPNGRSILVPQGSTAIDCARLFGHDPDWARR